MLSKNHRRLFWKMSHAKDAMDAKVSENIPFAAFAPFA